MAEDPALASPSRILRLLELACAYNSPLSIHSELNDEIHQYKSRMLDLKEISGLKTIIIDQPIADGQAAPLRPDAEIILFFAIEQGRYAFDSTILKKTNFELTEQRKVLALEITYPNVLKSGQRRAYFRVPVPIRMPIHMNCLVVADFTYGEEEEESGPKLAPRGRLKARVIDLSVGGMLVVFEEGDTPLVAVGTKLTLEFSLEKHETPIRLNSVVRRLIRKTAREQLRAGIEFVDINKTFEFKLAVNRLYKYVAERQREILQSGSKQD
jgi:c-di-GMP-binding flagellar brake protein YcgR